MPSADTAPTIHICTIQMRARVSNMFSKLLTATVAGKALMKPQIVRPAITAGRLGDAAMIMQQMVKPAEPAM